MRVDIWPDSTHPRMTTAALVLWTGEEARADSSQFIATTYPAIKDARPDLKVLIREASGIEPRAFARFGTWWFPVLVLHPPVGYYLRSFLLGYSP